MIKDYSTESDLDSSSSESNIQMNIVKVNDYEHYVTLFDSQFLVLGLALYKSLLSVTANALLWVLCMDERVEHELRNMQLPSLMIISLGDVETEELLSVKKSRSKGEYCWTLTPFAPQFVFDLVPTCSRVTYLDSDLYFFSSPLSIFTEFELSNKHVLITEHAYAPINDLSHRSGRFCVQFLTFRNTSEAKMVMRWWQIKCIEWCYDRIEDGKFGDQKYLDDWPAKFPFAIHILSQVDKTLAPWNADYYLDQRSDDFLPIFYHFQSFRIVGFNRVKLFSGVTVSDRSLTKIYAPYLRSIEEQIELIGGFNYSVKPMPEPKRRMQIARKTVLTLLGRLRYAQIRKSISIWAIFFDSPNGQSLVTKHVVDDSKGVSWIKCLFGGRGLSMFLTWIDAIIRLIVSRIGKKTKTIYLVCSRSTGGFLRDLPPLVLSLFNTRVIVHAQGSDIVDLLKCKFISPLARFLYKNCELIVPSTHLIDELKGFNFKKLYVLENFYQSTSAIQSGGEAKTFTVYWNSNIIASKGFFDVVDAVENIFSRGHQIQLNVIGKVIGDNELTESETSARFQQTLSHHWLHYFGAVSHEKSITLLANSDVVCLPSRYKSECQPSALIEAMCTGKEVVVADTPALRATVGDYPTHFVPLWDVNALTKALMQIAIRCQSNERCRFSSSIDMHNKVRVRFSKKRFDREINAILQD